MNLDDLQPAWRQYKLSQAMEPLEVNEVLSLIDLAEDTRTTRVRWVVLNLVLFLSITFMITGG